MGGGWSPGFFQVWGFLAASCGVAKGAVRRGRRWEAKALEAGLRGLRLLVVPSGAHQSLPESSNFQGIWHQVWPGSGLKARLQVGGEG